MARIFSHIEEIMGFKDYFKWIFTRWHFWIFSFIVFFLGVNERSSALGLSYIFGQAFGSILVVFVFYSIGAFFWWVQKKYKIF